LLTARPLESKECIYKLKKDKTFQDSITSNLLVMHYTCGYNILNESSDAKLLTFYTDLSLCKDSFNYCVSKKVSTYFITEGYLSEKGYLKHKKMMFNGKTKNNWLNEKAVFNLDNKIFKLDLSLDQLFRTFNSKEYQKLIKRKICF